MSADKTIIITGANSGLGFECAKAIACSGESYHIVLACRDKQRGEAAVDQIANALNQSKNNSNVKLECMVLDLTSLTSVRKFAAEFKTKLARKDLPPLKAILCNAGLQHVGLVLNEDGFEQTFAVNHLGHFLLVLLLVDQITAPARIMIVSSGTHDPKQKTGMEDPVFTTAEMLAHPDEAKAIKEGSAFGRRCYTTSKLCNVLFAYELERRLKGQGLSTDQKPITVNSYDPGLLPGTGLARDYHWTLKWMWEHVLPFVGPLLLPNTHTAEKSGSALAHLMIDASMENISGKYFNLLKQLPSSETSYSTEKQLDLWNGSVKLCNLQSEETILAL